MERSITSSVRHATESDSLPLAETLAASFNADPVMSWCYPDAVRRAEILPQNFRSIVNETLPFGEIYTVADAVGGAVWIPPESVLNEELLAEEIGRISGEFAERVFTLLALMDAHHPHEPHQYLWLLGTRPEWQSRGIGSALMQPMLDRCDQDGMPAYLEATSERNRDLYARHGFALTKTISPPDGPPLWCMWRAPKRQ
ncbi:GNAT family N-acetyltransferase [Hoyosella rhizosphaerae]|uniref:GCN5-like N-acetyltransferase n=1 Tax=Hoyosella rhizosphaerae TaxID=1755582 RepID=A0A916XGU0_9ACTN|nr:GNAT family N-acetyltransferase [Hoyosella rhizosphaerae]MBN4928112.1 GNAT family N-acetyltransferase [Hoyosella rhizosphaerae]GGC72478.1 GCN5-like N-acetyltransferase [Hoyosella rhizosphaerae]